MRTPTLFEVVCYDLAAGRVLMRPRHGVDVTDIQRAETGRATYLLAQVISVAGTTINAVCAAFAFLYLSWDSVLPAFALYGGGLLVGAAGLVLSRLLQGRTIRTWWWLAQLAVPLVSPILFFLGYVSGLVPIRGVP